MSTSNYSVLAEELPYGTWSNAILTMFNVSYSLMTDQATTSSTLEDTGHAGEIDPIIATTSIMQQILTTPAMDLKPEL